MANTWGAIGGTAIGLAMSGWLTLGALIRSPIYPRLNVSVELCYDPIKFPQGFELNFDDKVSNFAGVDKFYAISFMWYTLFGALVTIISGLFISAVTGGLRNKVDKSLVICDFSKFCKLE